VKPGLPIVCASFPDAEMSPFTLPVANLWQNAGLVFAGLAAGGWAQVFDYPSMLLACAGISGLGLLMIHLQSKMDQGAG